MRSSNSCTYVLSDVRTLSSVDLISVFYCFYLISIHNQMSVGNFMLFNFIYHNGVFQVIFKLIGFQQHRNLTLVLYPRLVFGRLSTSSSNYLHYTWLADEAPGNFHLHLWVYEWGLHVCTVNCPIDVSKHKVDRRCWSCPDSGRYFHC